MIRELPTDCIDARADARQIDEATVAGLVDSIGTVGLINPIRVRAVAGRWEVIAGHHRLTACKRLGLVEIAADVIESDDLHAELAMIDENLCRAELSPADRAHQTARRKAIYLELHPETDQGGNWQGGQFVQTDTASFAAETAKVVGKDERTVRRDAERGEKIIDAALNVIRGTSLDTGTYLDRLKKLSPSEQVYAAKRDLAHANKLEREKRSGLARRIVPLSDEDAADVQFAALVAAWNKAGEAARHRFREEVVDAPVFDRSAA